MANNDSANSALSTQQSKLYYWLPPIIWMAAIFSFSTDAFSGENTGSLFYKIFHALIPSLTPEQFQPIHILIRKAAHFTEYGILALALFRAFRAGALVRWSWRWAVYSLVIVAAYALLDEFHQTFTLTRGGSIYDSLLDFSGGATALLMLWGIRKSRRD